MYTWMGASLYKEMKEMSICASSISISFDLLVPDWFGKNFLFLQYPGSDKVKMNRMAFEIFGCSTCL